MRHCCLPIYYLYPPTPLHTLSVIFPSSHFNFFFSFRFRQLKNSLRDNLCLDQGPDGDNAPIMYLCHGMTPQVSCSVLLYCSLYSVPSGWILWNNFFLFWGSGFDCEGLIWVTQEMSCTSVNILCYLQVHKQLVYACHINNMHLSGVLELLDLSPFVLVVTLLLLYCITLCETVHNGELYSYIQQDI